MPTFCHGIGNRIQWSPSTPPMDPRLQIQFVLVRLLRTLYGPLLAFLRLAKGRFSLFHAVTYAQAFIKILTGAAAVTRASSYSAAVRPADSAPASYVPSLMRCTTSAARRQLVHI